MKLKEIYNDIVLNVHEITELAEKRGIFTVFTQKGGRRMNNIFSVALRLWEEEPSELIFFMDFQDKTYKINKSFSFTEANSGKYEFKKLKETAEEMIKEIRLEK